MDGKRFWPRISLALIVAVVFGLVLVLGATAENNADSSVTINTPHLEVVTPPPGTTFSTSPSVDGDIQEKPLTLMSGTAITLEVFTNTWASNTLGFVYDPGRDYVRYAHESQSSTSNPTIYDVDYPPAHTMLMSYSLSTINSGWPWQIDNRDGAGYDFVADTYFLPDYNGDLSYADDNIVEIAPDGTILNAWEMDDEVGSNDSSDGSAIDEIIDIAVVPGTPTRYFATAAYDTNLVYEIELLKTGTWWTPNTWRTVATCTVSGLSDNLGIDYDAVADVLYHSGWHTTTLIVTDLTCTVGNPMNTVAEFDCPGAGGYNSGVTSIENASPPEVWVTDFSSDQTTRCLSPIGEQPVITAWDKWVQGQPWVPDIEVDTETGDVVMVTDVITAVDPFTLTETWDDTRLELLDVTIIPDVGTVMTTTGSMQLVVPAGPPEMVTVEKLFFVKPCIWTETLLTEHLLVEGAPPLDESRNVTINKLPSQLELDSSFLPDVNAGQIVSFTLTYSNTGGFENSAWISNTFPITASFAFADPYPDEVDPDRTWARWNLGSLATDDQGSIDAYVAIDETLPTASIVNIWDGIFDHADVLRDEALTEFHVTNENFNITWEKYINGEPWEPGFVIPRETSQTLVIQDVMIVPQLEGFSLLEEWNPEHLALLLGWTVESSAPIGSVTVDNPGFWSLEVAPLASEAIITVTKEFHVEPCVWGETILWEILYGSTEGVRTRPVIVEKIQPDLWLYSDYDSEVYSRQEASYVLHYGNAGGLESQAWVTATFPIDAPYVDAVPSATAKSPDNLTAWWDVGELAFDQQGTILVNALVAEGVPPSEEIGIWNGIFNHVGELAEGTTVVFEVPPPTWEKWVESEAWTPDTTIAKQTGDTFTVVDVVSTQSAAGIIDHWNEDHLVLNNVDIEPDEGYVETGPGYLSWEFPDGVPGTITITKIFAVQPCTWTYTVLWEELWVEGIEWERRPSYIDKIPSNLWVNTETSKPVVIPGREATFMLEYGNAGGLESRAWISTTLPVSAAFVGSDPPPTVIDGLGRWVLWDVGELQTGAFDVIAVTVEFGMKLPTGTPIDIESVIYDHADVPHDSTALNYIVGPSVYLPTVLKLAP